MKKTILTIAAAVAAFSLSALGQPAAKKPVIMVIPSDAYCIRNGFTISATDPDGKAVSYSDYKTAYLKDDNLRQAISAISAIMAKENFPLKDMEQTLKSMENKEAEALLLEGKNGGTLMESPLDKIKKTAKADIILDLDFDIKRQGPNKYVSFNLRGLDAYTNKAISTVSGDGKPSSAVTTGTMIHEAVINRMDNFNNLLLAHFSDMFENGREVTISIKVTSNCPAALADEFEFLGETVQLNDVIEYWMDEHTVNHRFSRTDAGDYFINYEQVRIPLFKTVLGKERAIDTRGFATDLGRFLNKDPFNLPYKIYERGLGEVWVILGD